MKKYGIEHFFVEEIEETEELDDREIYWIKYYNSYENGYNATLGGGGNARRDYQQIIDLYKEYKNTTKVAQLIGCERHLVSRVLKANNIEVISSAEVTKINKSKSIE
jgi:DNA invertase Pin-like site-specific DNA recombinase